MLLWLAPVALLALYLRFPFFFQDVHHIYFRLAARKKVTKYVKTNYTILDRFADLVQSQPNKPLLLFRDETFSYRDADELSNQTGRVLLQSGRLRQGDTVALFVVNEPMFMWLWLGLVKVGCSAAFLNSNIRSRSLLHSFTLSGATTLLVSAELQDAVEEVLPTLLEQQVTVFILADTSRTAGIQSFTDKMSQASSEPLPKELHSQLTLQSPAVYIYTSGTTGLPKSAVIPHSRLWTMSLLTNTVGMNINDVIYISLPLYHSAGFAGMLGAMEKGMTVALRSKFSTSQFWDDCRKYNVTVIQYIGEIMRYLCNTPKKPTDRNHKVRLAFGNGIRPDVWREFLNRFGNIQITEFYGATEGNFSLVNYSNKIGAIGRDSFLLKWFFPHALIKYDVEKDEAVRDSSGFCIEVPKGEAGLLVCKITPKTPFIGYTRDLEQTEKKRLHNVFERGDVYFNTGDLLVLDTNNFFYFQDRVGDTFRWKGENVATNEVCDILALVDCISEANVYGVEVPGHEGRVGMAAVILRDGHTFDSAGVCKHLENYLPSYARPRFIRIKSSLDVTSTFKHLKSKLSEEGFDPGVITDPLYILDEKETNFIPLTVDKFNAISSGKMKI